MTIGEFFELYDVSWDLLRGRWLSLGAPIIRRRMSSLRQAMHVHGLVLHVHSSSHSGTVMSCGLDVCALALVSV